MITNNVDSCNFSHKKKAGNQNFCVQYFFSFLRHWLEERGKNVVGNVQDVQLQNVKNVNFA